MKAIQDQITGNHCYGCGPDNPDGHRIKSYYDGEVSRCRYQPTPAQCAGPEQYVYGGLIASLVDCHSIGTSIAAYYQKEGRAIGEGDEIWCVTGRLTVNYLKPTPIDKPIELEAVVEDLGERKARVRCKVSSDGQQTAEGEVIAVRVPPGWRG
jgi:acyl-coenzyme A thioesterase PaaI-like protein